MEIAINIQANLYERIKCLEPKKNSNNMLDILMVAVQNGTPLPEHHGDLIDKKEVYKKLYSRCLANVATEVLNEVLTIIPATKEGDEE